MLRRLGDFDADRDRRDLREDRSAGGCALGRGERTLVSQPLQISKSAAEMSVCFQDSDSIQQRTDPNDGQINLRVSSQLLNLS